MSKINVNQVDTQCGSTLTLGSSGKTVTLASGASQSGFGRTGTVDWCTTAKTSPFTAVSGDGFFVDTSSGAVTVTLPASPNAGDIVSIADYTNTFCTHNVTVGRNGSKIGGVCADAVLETQGQSITLVYVDGTEGWKNVQDSTSNVTGNPGFIAATGGTITTSGDYKIHTFNADGCFAVTNTCGSGVGAKVSYVVVAGGGASGQDQGAGGGAGGYREGKQACGGYTASPLAATPCSGLTVTEQTYPITIGAGGAGGPYPSTVAPGSNSIFSTITSAGGGGGGSQGPAPGKPGQAGGSGGGGSEASGCHPGGAGNTPPVSPPQGNPGGINSNGSYGGGGGGAGEAGNTDGGGHGGDGVASSITASPVTRAGGGSSGATPSNPAGIAGGDGGGGTGAYPGAPGSPTVNGTANTGGGAGGGSGYFGCSYKAGSSGGSGIVIIRYKFQ